MLNFNVVRPLQIPLRYLNFLGLWDVTSIKKTSHRVVQICLHLFFCELFIVLQLINIFSARDVDEVFDLLGVVLTIVSFSIKSLHFIVCGRKIVALIEDVKELSKFSETENELKPLPKRVKQAQKVYKFTTIAVLALTFFLAVDVVTSFIINPSPYRVPHKFWTPFDYESNVYWFGIVAVYQIIDVLGTSSAAVALDFLPIYFLLMSCGFIEDLSGKLEKVCNKNKEVNVINVKSESEKKLFELKKCIAIHQKIKAFVKKTEEIFSVIIFTQFSMSLITLCAVVSRISKVCNLWFFYKRK
jgi:7tm Odorant receptor